MRRSFLLTTLIVSGLAANAQNYTNIAVQTNYTFNSNNVQQSNANPNYNINQFASNNVDIQVQTNRGRGSSSAMQNLGNTGNNTNKQIQSTNNKPKVQTRNVSNVNIVNDEPNRGNRGNNFDLNENAPDNNVGDENVNRGRGGNIMVNDAKINSNPIVNDNKKVVASKPVIQDAPGLDFKPSGLSGRDYSNGGKLKKGQRNFYKGSTDKTKTVHRKKPKFKKIKYHTSKCAKW